MHATDAQEAEARRVDAAFKMPIARARFRVDLNPNRLTFRVWARRTYQVSAASGKLARILGLVNR